MASMPRSIALRLLPSLLILAATAQAQVPLPPAAQILKPVGEKVLQAILKPKMKVDHFTMGGFTVKDVDPTSDATAEHFEGEGTLELPPPAEPLKITFKNLVLKGSAAEGTVEAGFHAGHHSTHQGWTYQLKKAVISDKGSHLEGRAELAGIRLDVAPLTYTPGGLQGSLSPGDLPLAEGAFTATLKGAEVIFSTKVAPQLKGTVHVEIEPPVRHGATGADIVLDSGPVAFNSEIVAGSGPVVDNLATDLPLLHRGSTFRMDKVTFAFERGTPLLAGPTRFQFPLNIFCRVGATGDPYLTGPATCSMRGQAAKPDAAPRLARTAARVAKKADLFLGFEGFSASFPLGAATLHPSGLTSYKLAVNSGTAAVHKGELQAEGSTLSAKLSWGPNFAYELDIANAPADFADGLYVAAGSMTTPAQVGAYKVHSWIGAVVTDFSDTRSPVDYPATWKGVYLPGYAVVLPDDFYVPLVSGKHEPITYQGLAARFEANGGFSCDLAVAPAHPVMLWIVPVKLQPFELVIADGVVMDGPALKGTMTVNAPPLLDKLEAPITFRLTQEGVEQVEVQAGQVLDTGLIGVDTVLDKAVLNPTNLDFTGRFDFNVSGANLPSIPFDHLVFQASGGGIDGDNSPLKLGVAGQFWANLADHPKVDLWGFGFDLAENGFGVSADGRYYVGFGGQMDVNPLVPSIYNRVLFTTEAGQPKKGVVEIEKAFHLDQGMSGLGTLKVDLGFGVEAKGDDVSKAYFLGTGKLKLDYGEAPFAFDAGVLFGRQMQGGGKSFPYFYALGHVQSNSIAVPIAPDVELYGFAGGLAQNFKPDELRNTTEIKGTPDQSLGYALMAGVDVGTIDQYVFHGGLDLYISQNLTTILQGKGWLFCPREASDNEVTANISFTRNPNVFDASFSADIKQAGGMMRYMGVVGLHFGPDKQFLHVGTPEAPIKAVMAGLAEGNGYFTADFQGGAARLAAGEGFGVDTGQRNFGPLYGRAWLNARGDLVIELDADKNPHFKGVLQANGGAEFGMEFETFWDTYHITIFSGDFAAAMAFQAPGSPRLSGRIVIHYSVLGGLFDGDIAAHLDF